MNAKAWRAVVAGAAIAASGGVILTAAEVTSADQTGVWWFPVTAALNAMGAIAVVVGVVVALASGRSRP